MDLCYAALTATIRHGGLRILLTEGDVWDAGDTLVAERPELFTTEPPIVRRIGRIGVELSPVEDASATPGRKRPAKKAARRD